MGLIGGQGGPVSSETENISSEGFYCLCPEPFTIGEELECTISIPSRSGTDGTKLILECRVRVVRVETYTADGPVGIGFHIETFSVMTKPGNVGLAGR